MVLIYLIFIIYLLRKSKLELKYALLWLLSGIIVMAVLIFPAFFLGLASKIGIVEPVNMIFLLQGGFLLLICISLSVIVSGLNKKIRILVQETALLEKRIRDLEEKRTDAE